VLAYIAAIVANSIADIISEVWAINFPSNIHKNSILLFREVIRQVHMQRAAAIAPTSEIFAVQLELTKYIGMFIFNYIEVAVINITRNPVTIFAVPFCVLYS
jgi:hypothetical protein